MTFKTAYELYTKRHYLFRLSGKTLSEWSRELNMDSTKVLALLACLQKEGKIKEVIFV